MWAGHWRGSWSGRWYGEPAATATTRRVIFQVGAERRVLLLDIETRLDAARGERRLWVVLAEPRSSATGSEGRSARPVAYSPTTLVAPQSRDMRWAPETRTSDADRQRRHVPIPRDDRIYEVRQEARACRVPFDGAIAAQLPERRSTGA